MKFFALYIVLVIAVCPICHGGLFSRKEKPDPVNLLSDRLTELTDDEDMGANVKVAIEHDWQADPEAAQVPFMSAVEAFKNFKTEEPCHTDNIFSVMTLQKLVGPNNMEFLLFNNYRQRRVFRFLDEIKEKMRSECFLKLEQKWNDEPERSERFRQTFAELVYLGPLMTPYKTVHMFQLDSDVQELDGAVQLIKNANSKKYRLDAERVKSVLLMVHRMKGENDPLKSLSKERAAKLIEDYLVKPCQKLREQPEVGTLFGPIMLLGAIVPLDDSIKVKDMKEVLYKQPRWESLFWPSRWAFCKMFVDQADRKRLADKVASIRL